MGGASAKQEGSVRTSLIMGRLCLGHLVAWRQTEASSTIGLVAGGPDSGSAGEGESTEQTVEHQLAA